MTIGGLRLLTLAALLVLALPATALAGPSAVAVDRGVVQSADSMELVLRALDGTVVTYTVTPRTRVRVNRERAAIADVAPGYVATVRHDRKMRALLVEAVGTPAGTTTDRGMVTALTRTSITLRAADGGTLTVMLDRRTRFRLFGRAAGWRVARPGTLVTVAHAPDAPALVVNVLKRPGA